MAIQIDEEYKLIHLENGESFNLYSKKGFELISKLYLKVGWDQKHLYTFTWLGRPIIQLPEDMLRIQEVIFSIKPDYIIETGIAHGGSLIYYSSICESLGNGEIIGVDIDIREHNRIEIENHRSFNRITMIQGSSIDQATISKVEKLIKKPNPTILVILDSAHDYNHVYRELELYSKFVSPGSFIVATDGSQEFLIETDRAHRDYPKDYVSNWKEDNSKRAAQDFVRNNSNFEIIETPKRIFSESEIDFNITLWPSAYIRKNI